MYYAADLISLIYTFSGNINFRLLSKEVNNNILDLNNSNNWDKLYLQKINEHHKILDEIYNSQYNYASKDDFINFKNLLINKDNNYRMFDYYRISNHNEDIIGTYKKIFGGGRYRIKNYLKSFIHISTDYLPKELYSMNKFNSINFNSCKVNNNIFKYSNPQDISFYNCHNINWEAINCETTKNLKIIFTKNYDLVLGIYFQNNFTNLINLDLTSLNIDKPIIYQFTKLTNLVSLTLNSLNLIEMPDLSTLNHLEYLSLSYNKITSVPDNINSILSNKITTLRLDNNNISYISSNIKIYIDLIELKLNNNCLKHLPIEITEITKLKYVIIKFNNIGSTIPFEQLKFRDIVNYKSFYTFIKIEIYKNPLEDLHRNFLYFINKNYWHLCKKSHNKYIINKWNGIQDEYFENPKIDTPFCSHI